MFNKSIFVYFATLSCMLIQLQSNLVQSLEFFENLNLEDQASQKFTQCCIDAGVGCSHVCVVSISTK